MPPVVLIALALALVTLEATLCRVLRRGGYDLMDTLANIAVGSGALVTGMPGRATAVAASFALYEYRLFELPDTAWVWVLLILAEDLCYYGFHRASHTIPMLWAAHVTHHSSHRFNLSTALRASWTTPFTGIVFWLPLPLLGFHPLWIVAAHGISLGYQFFMHTELVGRLGPLEWVLNTPSHHRVHHARDDQYLDRNFGGILIVWDRLFGTFAAEQQRPTYGTLEPVRTHHPVVIALHGWGSLLRAAMRPGLTVGQRLMVFVGRPRRATRA